MFSRQGGLSNQGGSNNHLVEFRAGRMNLIGKMVHPDTRKGLVYMTQSDDGLMHFCWKNRTTGKVEDDLIVFPDDFEYKRVEQCTTGRVYVLKFKTNTRRMFFWMQEPKTDKDDEYCRRVNELLNNPPSITRSGQEGGDIQYMLNNMSQQQLMQLFGGVGQMGGLSSLLGSMNTRAPSSRNAVNSGTSGTGGTGGGSTANIAVSGGTTATESTSSNAGSATKSSGNKSSNSAADTVTEENTGGSASSSTTDANVSGTETSKKRNEGGESRVGDSSGGSLPAINRTLSTEMSTSLVNSEVITDIAANSDEADTLSVHLPVIEGMDDNKKKQVLDTILSPQFQQALTHFLNAVQSCNLGPVVSQFRLPREAVTAAYDGNIENFVKALEMAKAAAIKKAASENSDCADTNDGKAALGADKASSPKSAKDDKQDKQEEKPHSEKPSKSE